MCVGEVSCLHVLRRERDECKSHVYARELII